MRGRTLSIGVRTFEEGMERNLETARQLDAGWRPKVPIEGMYFGNLSMFLKALTPRRMELVHAVKQHGPISIRALAKLLQRDYRNVHADVQQLHEFLLLKKRQDLRYYVPYDKLRIDITVPLTAAPETTKVRKALRKIVK